MEKVYVLNIDDVNDYITEKNPDCEEIVGELESFDEETCKKIVENSMDYYSDVFLLEEFNDVGKEFGILHLECLYLAIVEWHRRAASASGRQCRVNIGVVSIMRVMVSQMFL